MLLASFDKIIKKIPPEKLKFSQISAFSRESLVVVSQWLLWLLSLSNESQSH